MNEKECTYNIKNTNNKIICIMDSLVANQESKS